METRGGRADAAGFERELEARGNVARGVFVCGLGARLVAGGRAAGLEICDRRWVAVAGGLPVAGDLAVRLPIGTVGDGLDGWDGTGLETRGGRADAAGFERELEARGNVARGVFVCGLGARLVAGGRVVGLAICERR